ncbi:MAG: hypothetical protein AAFX87_27060 [Bacteroidota bacterium]
MKSLSDKEIQDKLDAGEKLAANQSEGRLYKEVYNHLNKMPEFELSPSFADSVVGKVEELQTSKRRSKDNLFLILSTAGIFLVSIILMVILGVQMKWNSLSYLWENKLMVLFGIVVIVAIQFADRSLVRYRPNR